MGYTWLSKFQNLKWLTRRRDKKIAQDIQVYIVWCIGYMHEIFLCGVKEKCTAQMVLRR